MSTGRCKYCRHATLDTTFGRERYQCDNPKVFGIYGNRDDGADEWQASEIHFGPTFGCVNFEARDGAIAFVEWRPVSPWRPIETAPERTNILVAWQGDKDVTIMLRANRKWYSAEERNQLLGSPPTHWMPLPEPPVVEEARPSPDATDILGGVPAARERMTPEQVDEMSRGLAAAMSEGHAKQMAEIFADVIADKNCGVQEQVRKIIDSVMDLPDVTSEPKPEPVVPSVPERTEQISGAREVKAIGTTWRMTYCDVLKNPYNFNLIEIAKFVSEDGRKMLAKHFTKNRAPFAAVVARLCDLFEDECRRIEAAVQRQEAKA